MDLEVRRGWERVSSSMNSEDLSISLGHNISVFQAEMHAVRLSVSILETLNLPDKKIYICSNSQAMLMALRNARVTSKLTWECMQALIELAYKIPVVLPGFQVIQAY